MPDAAPLPSPEDLVRLIENSRLDVSTETALQRGLRTLFSGKGIPFDAEVILSPQDRIDFLIGDIGIEAKIKASPRAILRQLDRYAEDGRIGTLILATATSFVSRDLEARGKRVLVASLSRGWL
ncbi:hypothetical protein LAZ40_07175 [Cereibacter sphaeroides]|uniref:hypothetical protein n=1 Tax=Cereibacter sphaeroides TaxID=1063 RepID=UPI001F1BB53E|nr:hypothetical protein [Cereibacter sphaeroides]MCE6958829.1 hypothetical protein [Cereibacter sphaeroides]MCE6973297.1 hypothetical protein [Cereibacter sphaeroides]